MRKRPFVGCLALLFTLLGLGTAPASACYGFLRMWLWLRLWVLWLLPAYLRLLLRTTCLLSSCLRLLGLRAKVLLPRMGLWSEVLWLARCRLLALAVSTNATRLRSPPHIDLTTAASVTRSSRRSW
jgi:hypothetical protein